MGGAYSRALQNAGRVATACRLGWFILLHLPETNTPTLHLHQMHIGAGAAAPAQAVMTQRQK
jgi:hypothetical protein